MNWIRRGEYEVKKLASATDLKAPGVELLISPGTRHSFENGTENLEGIMLKTNSIPGDIFED